jgi:3-hydroxyisobutyrate dehydrogenase
MTRVAVLGTGIMGAGMARSLARAGLDVAAWNRNPDKARPMADDGIAVAEKPEEAVAGAAVVVTMLFDAASVAEVMTGALQAMADGAVWVQTSTVGHRRHRRAGPARPRARGGVRQTRPSWAPGSRRAGPAHRAGRGSDRAARRVAPVFDAIGAKTVWVGDEPRRRAPAQAGGQRWVLSVVTGTAQSITLAEKLGLDPQLFLDAIAGGAMDAPYVQLKGRAMVAGDYPPAFAVDGALKDSGLIADALRADRRRRPADHRGERTVRRRGRGGRAGEDMAAVAEVFRR